MSNVLSFTGTVGRDAEVKSTQSGQTVLTVTVANNVGFGDKQKTNWIRVTLWGKRAEGQLVNYLKKGQQIFVSGELTTQTYQGKDGVNQVSLELNANIVDLVGGKANAQPTTAPQQQQPQHQQQYQPQRQQERPAVDNFSDDIPF